MAAQQARDREAADDAEGEQHRDVDAHWPTECSHSGSRSFGFFGSHGGIRCAGSSVAPAAPIAQRDGISQARLLQADRDRRSGKRTPVKTTWTIANITSSGIVFSEVFTSEEMTRPNIIDVKPERDDRDAQLDGRRHQETFLRKVSRRRRRWRR